MCVSANMNNYAQHMGNSAVCFPVFVSICQSVCAVCCLTVRDLLNISEAPEMSSEHLVGASMSLCYISVLKVVYDLISEDLDLKETFTVSAGKEILQSHKVQQYTHCRPAERSQREENKKKREFSLFSYQGS